MVSTKRWHGCEGKGRMDIPLAKQEDMGHWDVTVDGEDTDML